MLVLIQSLNSDWFTKKKSKCDLYFNLNQVNSWFINCNLYTQNKIKNKLCVEVINYACFKMAEKASRSVKKNRNCINVLGDKFPMSIR